MIWRVRPQGSTAVAGRWPRGRGVSHEGCRL